MKRARAYRSSFVVLSHCDHIVSFEFYANYFIEWARMQFLLFFFFCHIQCDMCGDFIVSQKWCNMRCTCNGTRPNHVWYLCVKSSLCVAYGHKQQATNDNIRNGISVKLNVSVEWKTMHRKKRERKKCVVLPFSDRMLIKCDQLSFAVVMPVLFFYYISSTSPSVFALAPMSKTK